MAKTRVTDQEFVTAFAKAKSLDEVAEKLGVTKQAIQVRASGLRKAGVNLPKFARKKKEVDVAGLNAIIGKLAKGKK